MLFRSAIVLVLDKEDVEEPDEDEDEVEEETVSVPVNDIKTEKKTKKPKNSKQPIGFRA